LRDQPWTDRAADVARAAAGEPLLDVVLRPGDVLYLPSGYLHAAQALGETSAHLTVGVHTWRRAHLVAELVRLLGDVEELRAPLPLGVDVADPASLVLELQHTVDLLREQVGSISSHAVAASLATQANSASRAEPVAPLAQARAAEAVDLWTALRWRRHLRAQVDQLPQSPPSPQSASAPSASAPSTSADALGPQIRVRTAETSVTLPADAAPALSRLLAGEVLRVADLGRVDGASVLLDEERLEVARTLLRAALVVAV
jgi:hypothetical protein